MKLTEVKITKFKSISKSTKFSVEPDVTALVGKNESGKTATLQSIYRLNPITSGYREGFKSLDDYPRSVYALEKDKAGSTTPISLTFQLEKGDLKILSEKYGPDTLTSNIVNVYKNYDDDAIHFQPLQINSAAAAKFFLEKNKIDMKYLGETLEDTANLLSDKENSEELKQYGGNLQKTDFQETVQETLRPLIPKFQYFDDYSTLPGKVSIKHLQSGTNLSAKDETALDLLKIAGVETEDFTKTDYEERKALLEAAANTITDQLFRYWSQNKDLEIELDIDPNKNGNTIDPQLQVRIKNLKHRVTLNVSERSSGFIWFFSFLAAFSAYSNEDNRIILLDEPGTSLHAKAQNDLLRFIDEVLAVNHQVIYTTHSPFMINGNQLQRCRTVEDLENGTEVSKELWEAGSDTIFPLLGAMGVDLSQTLVIGPNQLLVEGPSDVVYLQLMSQLCQDNHLEGLDDRWTITPVGGLDKLPTFIALFGSSDLKIAVITDVASGGSKKINSLISQGLLEQKRFIPLTKVTETKEADIEDLFNPQWYLQLLRKSGSVPEEEVNLHGGRIIKQVQSSLGNFSHYQPADYLLRKNPQFLKELDDESIQRFARLFEMINKLVRAE